MEAITFTKLDIINVPKGNVYKGLKQSDDTFENFGEAYFTTIEQGCLKGWKKHLEMKMNLIVPHGDVKFHTHDQKNNYLCYRLNQENYGRLTVPAGCWMAFEGVGKGVNLILNIASIEHRPEESVSQPLGSLHYE